MQIQVPSSQLLTTFDTLLGRFCFMKLPFSLCESQYFFQYYMELNFESLTNAYIIASDILIVGSDLGPMMNMIMIDAYSKY